MRRAILLIGVSKPGGGLVPLQSVQSSLEDMKHWAEQQRFDIVKVFSDEGGKKKVALREIQDWVHELNKDLEVPDQLVIYYSGHGHSRSGPVWLLSDAPERAEEAVSLVLSEAAARNCSFSHVVLKHFEFLVLEGAQSGLSWTIVLKKREGYRRAFDGFDPQRVARFSVRRIEKLTFDSGIIRNRMNIEAAVRNAGALLKIREEFGSFDSYCWRFVDGRPKLNRWRTMRQIPATSPESDAFSKDLKHRGFSFVGPTVVYAHMQAVGMVNDHIINCFRYREIRQLSGSVG
jgi:DNA-3-methyladenine glycosylase I